MEELNITYKVIAWLCGAVILVGGAVKLIVPLFSPFKKISEKLDKHERQFINDFERLNKQDECDKVILRGMLACLKGLEELKCNGPVKQGIKDIEEYLINK